MRVDLFLTERGYVSSRKKAQTLIEEGKVLIDGNVVKKASQQIEDGEHNVEILQSDEVRFVGRGGLKLEAALDAFGIDATAKIALDIGASTGGFTDCLLQRGAQKVYAVDAGVGQLSASLLANPNVVSIEKMNARNLLPEHIDHTLVDLIVMDVSFQFCEEYDENTLSFVNNVRTKDGGTHEVGLKTAFTKAFNDYASKNGVIKAV